MKRTKIYIKVNRDKNEIICSGINFGEFINGISRPIENILILKGDYCGDNRKYNFDILEGKSKIESLTKEDIYNWGNFCFVDYMDKEAIDSLSRQEAAELLYIAHMEAPLNAAFFTSLKNHFVYLSHDDGWYSKIYCRYISDFGNVICNKITEGTGFIINEKVRCQLMELAENGILIDLDEIIINKKEQNMDLKIYLVGEFCDMDYLINNLSKVKSEAYAVNMLYCSNGEWSIH